MSKNVKKWWENATPQGPEWSVQRGEQEEEDEPDDDDDDDDDGGGGGDDDDEDEDDGDGDGGDDDHRDDADEVNKVSARQLEKSDQTRRHETTLDYARL